MTTTLHVVAGDWETYRFKMGCLAPKPVCLGVAGMTPEMANGAVPFDRTVCKVFMGATGNEGTIDSLLDGLFGVPHTTQYLKVFQRGGFDLAVVCCYYPQYIPIIFAELEAGRITDISVREKLLNLTTHGNLEYFQMQTPQGEVNKRLEFNLAFMTKHYLGRDRTGEKTDNDAYRTNYDALDGVPMEKWPDAAKTYLADDCIDPLGIWCAQERRREQIMSERGFDPFAVERFRVTAAFCFQLMSCWGCATDAAAVATVEEMLARELAPEKMDLLYKTGILRAAIPPTPHKRGAKEHVEGCKKKWKEGDYVVECNCPVKMTAGEAESKNTAVLKQYVEDLARRRPEVFELSYTEPSKRFPEGQIQVDAEWRADHLGLDPVIDQLDHRENLQKLVTTDIPKLKDPATGLVAVRVHPNYNELVRTGRCSSFGSESYPSMNAQNPHPDIRGCVVPDPGTLLWSDDYSVMELGTFAQTCIDLFGFSLLADKINAGMDPHAWLGAQIADAMDPSFRAYCTANRAETPDQKYEVFVTLKDSPHEGTQNFYKHFRKLAKPTGLGYPGGLGPKTFIAFAKATYDCLVDFDTSKMLKEIWMNALPEASRYFEWVNQMCIDPFNAPIVRRDKVTGIEKKHNRYSYVSPMGMVRAGADYCAVCNGRGLQTPGAEAAIMGTCNIVRAIYDPSLHTILGDDEKGPVCRVLFFIHDENVGTIRNDAHLDGGQMRHLRMMAISDMMVKAMRAITPDVKAKAQPVLMERWNKDASAVYTKDGILDVWRPKAKG